MEDPSMDKCIYLRCAYIKFTVTGMYKYIETHI